MSPLTLGTAGHIDHGKTALVARLTGVDTDRLPEERARGMTIVLGYAPLTLPSGRRLSVVDVPGHERFVRTMVAGATGVDLFLLVVAADDGVMPQTAEHVAVLDALAVRRGVVAVTKADVADPARAAAAARELLGDRPALEVVACSARTGEGVGAVAEALDRVAAAIGGRGDDTGPALLHVDRAFTIRGAGTVVTGTLWSGAIGRGDVLELLPAGRRVRVRAVQVHDEAVERAGAGQRVAVNLAGVGLADVARGDALAAPATVAPSWRLDGDLRLRGARHGARVQVHHGTREAPARLADLGDGLWQLRLERPLLARPGDRVVVRSIAPPDTLGGGVVLDAPALRHGRRPDVLERLRALRRGERPAPAAAAEQPPEQPPAAAPAEPPPAELSPGALALERRLLAAGHEPPSTAELGDEAVHLPALHAAGRAVRVGRDLHAHPDALAAVRDRVAAVAAAEGSVTLARLRDELGTSRRYAQALLEHLDSVKVTVRRPDDSRVLRRRGAGGA
jgi:selenocysteine-specific elongation factor